MKPAGIDRRPDAISARRLGAVGGYTLVEVLVAVVIFGILAGSAYAALDSLSRAAMAHRDRAGDFADLQMAVARLDSDLRQLVSRPVRSAHGQLEPALSGRRHSLAATRAGWANPANQRRGTLQRFGWQFSNGELVRESWPVTDRVPATQSLSETVLVGVGRFELRFRDETGGWQDAWPAGAAGERSLPTAIEVELETVRFGRLRRLVVLE